MEIDDRALRFNAEEARTYFATSISPAPDPQEIPRLIAPHGGVGCRYENGGFSKRQRP
ncbi:hypothetical protein [Raoultella ornithinolytica]|uniref:hypothetical protein n=1 Tax=Raoultella ornithinolytica TaxID=54291 RepID=UPI00358FC080